MRRSGRARTHANDAHTRVSAACSSAHVTDVCVMSIVCAMCALMTHTRAMEPTSSFVSPSSSSRALFFSNETRNRSRTYKPCFQMSLKTCIFCQINNTIVNAYLLVQSLVMLEQALQRFQHLHLTGHSTLGSRLPLDHRHAQRPLVSRHQTFQMFEQ